MATYLLLDDPRPKLTKSRLNKKHIFSNRKQEISTGDVLNANSGIVRDSSNVSIGRDTAPAPPSSAPGTRPSRSRSTREKGERDRDGPRRFSQGEHATNKPPRVSSIENS